MADGGGDSAGAASEGVTLKKHLGLLNCVGIIVGIIVGSGIFISPKGVLLEAGSIGLCLVVWTLCGLVCCVGAMCYAELGTCIPTSGADYGYIMRSHGDLPAFLFLWVMLVVVFPTANAITALTFSVYVLQPLYPGCEPPDSVQTLVAASVLTFLTYINCTNVKRATQVQDFFTVTKVLALIIIIATGFYMICFKGAHENFQEPFKNTNKDPSSIALAFYQGLFSYAGWNYLNFVTEELINPYQNLPRAIWISLPLVTVIYILANVAYFAVMSPAEMLASDAVAVTFADRTLGVMSWIMPLFVAMSTFGSLNGAILTSSRLFFVGARNGHLPDFLATINLTHITPLPSLVFGCITSCIMLFSNDIYTLINYVSFVETAFIGLSVSGLLILRYKHPNLHRPIKVNLFFPIFFLIICCFLIVTPLTSSPFECMMGLLVTASGIPVYIVGVMWKKKPESFTRSFGKFTALTQKFFYAVPEDAKTE